jgi:hypothetical protein
MVKLQISFARALLKFSLGKHVRSRRYTAYIIHPRTIKNQFCHFNCSFIQYSILGRYTANIIPHALLKISFEKNIGSKR